LGGRKGIRPAKKWGMVEMGTAQSGWSGAHPDGRCVCPEVLFWHQLTRVVPEKGP